MKMNSEQQKTKSSNIFYTMVSIWINWLPMCLMIDLTIQDFYPQHSQFKNEPFGKLIDPDCQIKIFYYGSIYVIAFLLLKVIFHKIQKGLKNKLNLLEQHITNNVFKSEKELLQFIHELFPNTTRILLGDNYNILLIGTCHLSETSAIQSSQIIKLIEPDAVVLELDEKRAKNMFEYTQQFNQIQLITDLFKYKTYFDPITLFARIGTRCMSFFCYPGNEFRLSAFTAWNLKNNCLVIYGDQDITKTIQSIERATPFWLMIILNICLICGYFLPLIYGFINVSIDFIECVYNGLWIMLLCKIIISCICWLAWKFLVKILIQISTEKSKAKYGMQRMNKILSIIGCILPCIAKIFRNSDVKTKRDEMLVENTLKTIQGYDGKNKLVVSVIGLAHMDDMYQIAKQRVKSDTFNAISCEV